MEVPQTLAVTYPGQSGGRYFHGEGKAVFLYHGTKAGNSIATASAYWLDNVSNSPANPTVPAQDEVDNKPGSQGWASWDPHGWRAEDGTFYSIFSGLTPCVFKASSLHSRWEYVGDFLAHPLEGVDLHEDFPCPVSFRWVING